MFSTPFWHLSQSLQYILAWKQDLGEKRNWQKWHTALNKGHKMSADIFTGLLPAKPIIRKEVQMCFETKVNKKTVKEILKLRPRLIEEIYSHRFLVVLKICTGYRGMYLHECRAC